MPAPRAEDGKNRCSGDARAELDCGNLVESITGYDLDEDSAYERESYNSLQSPKRRRSHGSRLYDSSPVPLIHALQSISRICICLITLDPIAMQSRDHHPNSPIPRSRASLLSLPLTSTTHIPKTQVRTASSSKGTYPHTLAGYSNSLLTL